MSNTVVAVNIQPSPATPKNAQGPANNPSPANDVAIAVAQVAQPAIPGQTITISWSDHLSQAARPRELPAKKLADRTVTPLNLRETLEKAGVPRDLIEKINPPPSPAPVAAPSPSSPANSSPATAPVAKAPGEAEKPKTPEKPKVSEMAAFATELLNKGYMQYLRFEEGDLPFSKEVCDELMKQKAIVDTCLETLEKTAKELSDELTKSSLSDCLPESNCSVDQKTALLALVLIAWTVLGVAGGAIVRNDPDAGTALLILGYIISGGALAGKLVSYNLSGKKEEADAKAQRTLKDAQDKLDGALESIRALLTKEQALLKRRAQHLIKDYVDATPFLNSTTKQERDASLRLTYTEAGDDRKKMQMLRLKMEIQAELIKHFVKNHFDRALPLIQKAMKSYMPEKFRPEHLLENFIDAMPIVFPKVGSAFSETQMDEVYDYRVRRQTDFIRLASAATRAEQTLPFTTLHAKAVRLFPLSCGSIAPAQFGAKASNSSDRREGVERKNGEDEVRSPTSASSERKDGVPNEGKRTQQKPQKGAGIGLPASTTRKAYNASKAPVSRTRAYVKR